jgi:hypothetical protein
MSEKNDRNSAKYKQWHADVLELWGNKCFLCGAKEKLHVHHIFDFKKFKTLRFDKKNGQVLCEKCHLERIHGHRKKKK